MRFKSLCVVSLLTAVTGAGALAEDIHQPPWRGDPQTTYARWEFSYPDEFPPPDEWYGPAGPPQMEVQPAEPWFPFYHGRQGVYVLSGHIWIDIADYPNPSLDKVIWIQLTWAPWSLLEYPNVEETSTPGGPYPASPIHEFPIGPENWMFTTFVIELHPNPEFETIHIWGDIYVDEVVIDTICWGRIPMDIKPGSCPNAFNPRGRGYLPVALLGTDGFDAATIDVSSVRLSRADGVGGEVAPYEGPPGPHSVIEDVGTPFPGDPCDCHEETGDGIADLSMKFRTHDVVAALAIQGLPAPCELELVAKGNLLDGTAFEARDCLWIVPATVADAFGLKAGAPAGTPPVPPLQQ